MHNYTIKNEAKTTEITKEIFKNDEELEKTIIKDT